MRLLRVEGTETRTNLTLLLGVVENEPILVGQMVSVLSASGDRDFGTLMMILPNGPGQREIDRGMPGARVKVILRRTPAAFPDDLVMALEKLERE